MFMWNFPIHIYPISLNYGIKAFNMNFSIDFRECLMVYGEDTDVFVLEGKVNIKKCE